MRLVRTDMGLSEEREGGTEVDAEEGQQEPDRRRIEDRDREVVDRPRAAESTNDEEEDERDGDRKAERAHRHDRQRGEQETRAYRLSGQVLLVRGFGVAADERGDDRRDAEQDETRPGQDGEGSGADTRIGVAGVQPEALHDPDRSERRHEEADE